MAWTYCHQAYSVLGRPLAPTRPGLTPQHIQLYQPETLAIAEHSIDLGCQILLDNTSVLAKKSWCMDHIIKDAIELHPNHINWKECFFLTRSWKHLTHFLQGREQKAFSKNGAVLYFNPSALKFIYMYTYT
jgi:hypothetical protein